MRNKYIYYVVAVVALIIMICMMCRTAPRFVFSIQSFDLNTREITVGANSGIGFHRVPHDFMTIQHHDSCVEWAVNPKYWRNDSLMYYKINNVNPNFHLIANGSVTVNVPMVNGSSSQLITLSDQEIEQLLAGPESKYVMLRSVLQMRAQRDTTIDYTSIKQIRSCFARDDEDSPWGIVILDKYTTFQDAHGTSISYVMKGRTDSLNYSNDALKAERASTCKVQFYRMTDYTILPDEIDDDMFHIGKVHYIAKPVVVTTQWGAGHALITREGDDGLHIAFPKAITYIERIDSLRSYAASTSGVLTYQQNDGSFPVGHNLFLPAFSSALSRDACSLRVVPDTLAIIMAPQKYDMISGKMRILPGFDKKDINCGTGILHTQVGVIGNGFILSYLWLPLLVFIILVVSYRWLTETKSASDNDCYMLTDLAKDLPSYFTALFSIALAYAFAKSMIAFKLSYSYPYFEKITGITTISVTLMLILIFLLSLIFNHPFIKLERSHRKARLFVAPIVATLCLGLTWFAFKVMDGGMNAAILSSYYPSESGGLCPLGWTKALAMNDNHRTVPYMLAFCCLLLIILSPILLFIFERLPVWLKKTGNYWVNLVVGCILVVGASLLPGNYSTALITLLAVFGLSRTLLSINYEIPKYKITLKMSKFLIPKSFWYAMLACVFYFIAAFAFGDKGYLTNFMGYIFMGFIVYVMVAKTELDDLATSEVDELNAYRRGIICAISVSLLVAFLMIKFLLPVIAPVDTVDYGRAGHRINGALRAEKYYNSGFRYAVNDQEFMMIQDHYMFNADGSDPLSAEHVLHPSLSSGQSPVILNDVSAQSSFFGTYGWLAFVVFFLLLALLAWLVLSNTLSKQGGLSRQRLWRLMAILLWLSTTIYLYVSYSGFIPFTGRLIPGFGVDAVGEALETSILLALMSAAPLKELPIDTQNTYNYYNY